MLCGWWLIRSDCRSISLRKAIKEAVVAVTKPSTLFKIKVAGAGLAAATAVGMAVLVC